MHPSCYLHTVSISPVAPVLSGVLKITSIRAAPQAGERMPEPKLHTFTYSYILQAPKRELLVSLKLFVHSENSQIRHVGPEAQKS